MLTVSSRSSASSADREAPLLADVAHPNAATNSLCALGRQTLDGNRSPLRSFVAEPWDGLGERGWSAQTVDAVALAESVDRAVPPVLAPRLPDGPTFVFVEASIKLAAS